MDTAPLNRQQRRQLGRKRAKVTALPGSLAASRSRSAARSPATGIGGLSAADESGGPSLADVATEIPPLDDVASPSQNAADVAFTGYKGRHGTLKTGIVSTYGMVGMAVSRLDEYDGMLIAAVGENAADAWIAWGKADPRIMRVLQLCFGSPAALVLAAHAPLIIGIVKHHNINPLNPIKLPGSAGMESPAGDTLAPGVASTLPPLPYQPVGPSAPTEAQPASMPPAAPGEMLIFPDDGLPADVEVQIRQAARMLKRPYDEVRQEILVQLAQEQMAQNQHIQNPGALGAPIARE